MKISHALREHLEKKEIFYMICNEGYEIPYSEVLKEIREQVDPQVFDSDNPMDQLLWSLIYIDTPPDKK